MQDNEIIRASQEKLKQALEQKTEKPETLAREMLRQGDIQVTDILGWIDDQETAAMDSGDIALLEELDDIKKAVNEAYAKLKSGLEQAKRTTEPETENVDEGWETTPTEEAAGTEDIDAGWETASAEQGMESSEREMETIGDEREVFQKAFETLKKYSASRAEDVFGITFDEPEETVPGQDRIAFAK
jgi:hypothetical protein